MAVHEDLGAVVLGLTVQYDWVSLSYVLSEGVKLAVEEVAEGLERRFLNPGGAEFGRLLS